MRQPTGFMLITSLLLSALMSVFVAATLLRATQELHTAEQTLALQQAFQDAEGRLDQAIFQLRENPSLGETFSSFTDCPTTLGSTITGCTMMAEGLTNTLRRIRTTATVGGVEQRVEAVVEVPQESLFRWALFAEENMQVGLGASNTTIRILPPIPTELLGGGVITDWLYYRAPALLAFVESRGGPRATVWVDSYDSASGSYPRDTYRLLVHPTAYHGSFFLYPPSPPANQTATIQTNGVGQGAITLGWGTRVWGNAVAGPNADPDAIATALRQPYRLFDRIVTPRDNSFSGSLQEYERWRRRFGPPWPLYDDLRDGILAGYANLHVADHLTSDVVEPATIHGTSVAASAPVQLPLIPPPSGSPAGFSLRLGNSSGDCLSTPPTPTQPFTLAPPTVINVSTFNDGSPANDTYQITSGSLCHLIFQGDGEVHLERIAMGPFSRLELQGNITLVTNTLTLGVSSRILIGSQPVKVYVRDSIDFGQELPLVNVTVSSTVVTPPGYWPQMAQFFNDLAFTHTNGDGGPAGSSSRPAFQGDIGSPRNFTLYYDGTAPLIINGGGTDFTPAVAMLSGAIYAPNATVMLSHVDLFGSVVANRILADWSFIHQDLALSRSGGGVQEVTFRTWRQLRPEEPSLGEQGLGVTRLPREG
jgi:hypothetical protein